MCVSSFYSSYVLKLFTLNDNTNDSVFISKWQGHSSFCPTLTMLSIWSQWSNAIHKNSVFIWSIRWGICDSQIVHVSDYSALVGLVNLSSIIKTVLLIYLKILVKRLAFPCVNQILLLKQTVAEDSPKIRYFRKSWLLSKLEKGSTANRLHAAGRSSHTLHRKEISFHGVTVAKPTTYIPAFYYRSRFFLISH